MNIREQFPILQSRVTLGATTTTTLVSGEPGKLIAVNQAICAANVALTSCSFYFAGNNTQLTPVFFMLSTDIQHLFSPDCPLIIPAGTSLNVSGTLNGTGPELGILILYQRIG